MLVVRRPWVVVVLWLCVLCVSIPFSRLAHDVLHGGAGPVPGSISERVDRTVQTDFDTSFLYPVSVVFNSTTRTVQDEQYKAAVRMVQERLPNLAPVRDTHSYLDIPYWVLTSPDGHTTALLAGLKAQSSDEAEGEIPTLRAALAQLHPELAQHVADLQVLVTSDTAFNHDVNELSARDASRSEKRTVPFVALCLLVAFGAPVAAGLPLAVGFISTTVTGALVFALGHVYPLTILVENAASMVGLGTSIDYALVMVTRFREELAHHSVEDAVPITLATSGRAVAGSGTMVMVGMVSLFISPLQDIRSLASGCLLVVLVALAVSLSLLPALLALLGSRVDAPRRLSAWVCAVIHRDEAWKRGAAAVVTHPWRALICGLIAIALLTAPAFDMWTGTIEGKWMPVEAESRQGYDLLLHMGHSGVLTPISMLISAPAGQSMLTTPNLTALHTLVQTLQKDPRIESVQSLVSIDPTMGLDEYIANYEDPDMMASGVMKDAATAFLSRSRSATLVYVTPANNLPQEDLLALVQTLRRTTTLGNDLTVEVGGNGGWQLDLRTRLNDAFPPIVVCVMVLTWLSLFFVFRSWLLPIKAILMNLMSVGAAFGVLVAVFQWGWLASLIHLSEPPGRIVVAIPVILFGIVFGLSMDYEVFLVSRIQEFWLETGDNQQATILGLAATGRMITSAALIMVVVFGCFALADMVVVKMLGLGLAVAVAVDATVIRMLLVPAFMQLAGKWNWVPGRRGR
jgi:RND superfamily putative drug exporter